MARRTPQDARALFVAWTNEIGGLAAASAIGCSQSAVSHIRSGHRTPSLSMAAAIERATARWRRGPILAAGWAKAA